LAGIEPAAKKRAISQNMAFMVLAILQALLTALAVS
jgi:hypothetical protein